MILFALFALGGRWAQLHPERIVSKGFFIGPNTFGARAFRFEVAALGTFAVFGGAQAITFILLSSVAHSAPAVWIAHLIAISVGLIAAIYVRREVRRRPAYVSHTPNGWWP